VQLTAVRFRRVNLAVPTLAGAFSVGCGLVMLYEIGFVEGVLL